MNRGAAAVMKTFAYIGLVAPCKAFDQKISLVKGIDELSKFPPFILASIDFSIRVTLLFSVATLIEYLIGDYIYESYRLDWIVVFVIWLGFVHLSSYQIIFNQRSNMRFSQRRLRVYRLIRNLCYAPLPVFACVLPVMIVEVILEKDPYTIEGIEYIGGSLFVFMVSISVLEAIFRSRKPLGTDDLIKTVD